MSNHHDEHLRLSREERRRLKKEKKERKLQRKEEKRLKKIKKEEKKIRKERKEAKSFDFGPKNGVGSEQQLPIFTGSGNEACSSPIIEGKSVQDRGFHIPVLPGFEDDEDIFKEDGAKTFEKSERNEVPVTSKARTRIKNLRCTIRFLIAMIILMLFFIFFQIGMRISSPIKVSKDGILQAMKDPFGISDAQEFDSPLQVSEFGSKLTSLLDIHDMAIEQLDSIKSLRFAVHEKGDVVVHLETVSSATRSSDGTVTTMHLISGADLVIDEKKQPPFQVMFAYEGSFYKVVVSNAIVSNQPAAASSRCVSCPQNSFLQGTNCVCKSGFVFSTSEFSCIVPQPGLENRFSTSGVSYSDPPNNGYCIGNVTLRLVTYNGNGPTNITLGGPGNPWGGPLSNGVQASPFTGTSIPRCAQSWTYSDESGSQKNVPLTGCVPMRDFRSKQSFLPLGELDKIDEFDDLSWCPREDVSNYLKVKSYPTDASLLWGFCVPCPPTPAPTLSPTLQPTDTPTLQPTQNPSEAPTTPEPTTNPTKGPTEGPTLSPTLKPSNAPTLKPTRQPTKENETFSPTMSPTHFPTTEPSSSPTSINATIAPTTHNQTNAPTSEPTGVPSKKPTHQPSREPTDKPTSGPSASLGTPSPTSESLCIPENCQGREMSFRAASHFCTDFMDMELCTADQLRVKMATFTKLLRSEDPEIRLAAFQGEFSCFGPYDTGHIWSTSGNSGCGDDHVSTFDLQGNEHCNDLLGRGYALCCSLTTEEEESTYITQAESQFTSSATVGYAGSSVQYTHLRKNLT